MVVEARIRAQGGYLEGATRWLRFHGRCDGARRGARLARRQRAAGPGGGSDRPDVGALVPVRDQAPLFGQVASDSTAFRVIDRIASDPDLLQALRHAHARARARAWRLGVGPAKATIDLDATLLASHSEKEGAAGNFKRGLWLSPAACLPRRDKRGARRPAAAGQRRREYRPRPDRRRRAGTRYEGPVLPLDARGSGAAVSPRPHHCCGDQMAQGLVLRQDLHLLT